MVTNQERMRVLEMLQEGKITPEAAAQLLEALGEGQPEPSPVFAEAVQSQHNNVPGKRARWLRVRVTDTNSGRPRVNVRVPMSLVNLGMKLGAKFSPEIDGLDMEALLQAANEGLSGPFVDVVDEQDGEHVEVFLE